MLSRFLSEPLPPSIKDLITNRDKSLARFPLTSRPSQWRVSRRFLGFPTKDTAAACFYRIYQFAILDCNRLFRNEIEYFCTFHPDWAIAALPDPADTQDPARYGALAAMTYLLVDSFNRRIELGLPRDAPPIVEDWDELALRPKVLERVPEWAEKVAPLPDVLYIPNGDGQKPDPNDPEVADIFKQYSMIMIQPHIHFI